MVGRARLPRAPGHAFDDRWQAVLLEAGGDGFAASGVHPSTPPGRRLRMHPVGDRDRLASERGPAWRCADSPSRRDLPRFGPAGPVPDPSWPRTPRARLPPEGHETWSPGCCGAWPSPA
jgi:transposase